jgi:hypothetical protein
MRVHRFAQYFSFHGPVVRLYISRAHFFRVFLIVRGVSLKFGSNNTEIKVFIASRRRIMIPASRQCQKL